MAATESCLGFFAVCEQVRTTLSLASASFTQLGSCCRPMDRRNQPSRPRIKATPPRVSKAEFGNQIYLSTMTVFYKSCCTTYVPRSLPDMTHSGTLFLHRPRDRYLLQPLKPIYKLYRCFSSISSSLHLTIASKLGSNSQAPSENPVQMYEES
jgi:hypothetical protein